jgi:hypothetical protein
MIKVTFIHENETRNKSRYSELTPGDVMKTLYLETNSLRQEFGTIPGRIFVTIENREG